jgi:hypothetical protein
MKLTAKILAGAAALAFVTLTAGSLQAQVTNVVTISFTATEQNTNSTTNGVVITTKAPVTHSATTADILRWLAIDENAETNYSGTNFPSGAKLVAISGPENAPDVQVVDKHNNYLVDVSDILSLTKSGVYDANVNSGKSNDTNNLAAPTQTDQKVYSINYDDSLATSNILFSFAGVLKSTTTDTTPNPEGVYKETESHTMSSGQGDGLYYGNQFVITGASFKAGGTGELSDTNNP